MSCRLRNDSIDKYYLSEMKFQRFIFCKHETKRMLKSLWTDLFDPPPKFWSTTENTGTQQVWGKNRVVVGQRNAKTMLFLQVKLQNAEAQCSDFMLQSKSDKDHLFWWRLSSSFPDKRYLCADGSTPKLVVISLSSQALIKPHYRSMIWTSLTP